MLDMLYIRYSTAQKQEPDFVFQRLPIQYKYLHCHWLETNNAMSWTAMVCITWRQEQSSATRGVLQQNVPIVHKYSWNRRSLCICYTFSKRTSGGICSRRITPTRESVGGSFGDPGQILGWSLSCPSAEKILERATIAMPLKHGCLEHTCEMKALRFHVVGRGEALLVHLFFLWIFDVSIMTSDHVERAVFQSWCTIRKCSDRNLDKWLDSVL